MKRWVELIVCLFLAVVATAPSTLAADAPAVVVGRVYAIEGDLLRYIPEEKDWVAAVRDAPFSTGDTLYTGNEGMAELVVPNGTWIRIGDNTQIQFIALDTDLAEMDVASGVARFYNKGSDTVIKTTSPFGYVLAYPGAVFDFYVGENSAEAVSVKGKITFVHAATNSRYEISPGNPSILADQNQVTSEGGGIDPNWDAWNNTRENFWASKARMGGNSVGYLPPGLQPEAYVLEENGRWENIPYEGKNRRFWRPTTVSAGWSPFTIGRWTDWDGDQTWIPEEPFGYVTHHYGNWVYTRNHWYWAPPAVSMRVGLPLLDIGFFWNPGRVSWIHSGAYVGWVPLAPRETYYSHHKWGGPHEVVVTNVNLVQLNINIRNYAYANRAIVVPQNDFYRVNNYRNVRATNINSATIIKNYRAAPVVNNKVINNYTTNKQRFNYTNATVKEKPHNTVVNRIKQNEATIQSSKKENADVVQQQVKRIREGKINREARIESPKTTNYIVPADQANRPKSEIKLQQKEIKSSVKVAPKVQPAQVVVPQYVAPAKPGQARQVVVPQHTAPAQPEHPSQAVVPEHVAPVKQGQIGQVVIPEHATPVKQGQKERPGQVVVPQHTAPAQPGQPKKVVIPEHVAPVKPVQQPERVTPAKPEQVPKQAKPVKPNEKDKPAAKPEQKDDAAAKSDSVAPVRPGQKDKPQVEPGQQGKSR
jgi:hypothetical protein